MNAKLLELRDKGTFIPLLCVDMNPGRPYPEYGMMTEDKLMASLDAYVARMYLLRRCGYPCDGRPNIAITHLRCGGDKCSNDPYHWDGRTYPVAHKFIIEHWRQLKDGDVVDVQFILGETKEPKISERVKPYGDSR